MIDGDRVLAMINAERRTHGIAPLMRSDALDRAAFNKAADMLAARYFAHSDPSGRQPWVWLDAVGYEYRFAGENLAIGFRDERLQHKAWMESLTHRRNILDPAYTETGIAVVRSTVRGVREVMVVQFFARPKSVIKYDERGAVSEGVGHSAYIAPRVHGVSVASLPYKDVVRMFAVVLLASQWMVSVLLVRDIIARRLLHVSATRCRMQTIMQ